MHWRTFTQLFLVASRSSPFLHWAFFCSSMLKHFHYCCIFRVDDVCLTYFPLFESLLPSRMSSKDSNDHLSRGRLSRLLPWWQSDQNIQNDLEYCRWMSWLSLCSLQTYWPILKAECIPVQRYLRQYSLKRSYRRLSNGPDCYCRRMAWSRLQRKKCLTSKLRG